MTPLHSCLIQSTPNFINFGYSPFFLRLYNDLSNDQSIQYLFPYRKDVRLPVQLQRAMAAEAEAAREARAKVQNHGCFLRFKNV